MIREYIRKMEFTHKEFKDLSDNVSKNRKLYLINISEMHCIQSNFL